MVWFILGTVVWILLTFITVEIWTALHGEPIDGVAGIVTGAYVGIIVVGGAIAYALSGEPVIEGILIAFAVGTVIGSWCVLGAGLVSIVCSPIRAQIERSRERKLISDG
ncbi:MAG: hypothetical protein ABIG71_01220 [Candidatus Uhrbacteria bacterium]